MNPAKTRPHRRQHLLDEHIQTPALVWDLDTLDERVAALARFSADNDCALLYSVKASGVGAVLERIAPEVSGFACSSPFEAQLARHVLGTKGSVHITSPALHPGQRETVGSDCDHVTFNSLRQWQSLKSQFDDSIQLGLRINPELSIVADPRIDPCRKGSKLGIPLSVLKHELDATPDLCEGIRGLHIHTACGNRSFRGLTETIDQIEAALPDLLHQIEWFNLGGGYYFDKIRKIKGFAGAVSRLQEIYGLRVFIEPGTALVQNAAVLVSTVVDIIDAQTTPIAILDTTLNHMPEAFVYQFQPPVSAARAGADHSYVLAGATCLAGDIFGTYAFDTPLEIGERLVFEKMGAYTHGQSHWFNGVNLPAIYTHSAESGLVLERAFTYEDFARRCAVS